MSRHGTKRPVEPVFLTGRSLLNHFASEKKQTLWLSVTAGTVATLFLAMQWISFVCLVEEVIRNKQY
jgi:hypothetical protein